MERILDLVDEYALAFHLKKQGLLALRKEPRMVLGQLKDELEKVFLEMEELKRKLMVGDRKDEEPE